MDDAAVDQDLEVLDFTRSLTTAQTDKLVIANTVPSDLIEAARDAFKCSISEDLVDDGSEISRPKACTVYEHKDFPGTTLRPLQRYPLTVQILKA